MILQLYSDNLTLYGENLTLYESDVVPATDTRQPGGWLPIIYLDRNNRPIDLEKLEEQAVEAAPEIEAQIEAAFEAVEEAQEGPVDSVALEAMAAQFKVLAGLLARFDELLAMEMQARAMEAMRQAEDERDVELLLMAL
jgi:hypothetical protein